MFNMSNAERRISRLLRIKLQSQLCKSKLWGYRQEVSCMLTLTLCADIQWKQNHFDILHILSVPVRMCARISTRDEASSIHIK